jgi:ABC-type molybdate transport system ATPase subunit
MRWHRVRRRHQIARVTRRSLDRLQLKAGMPVYALVKAISLNRRSVGYA